MAMENCDVKYGEITHSISIVNVRVSAIQALFQLDQEIIGLKDTATGMIVLPNENGTFPNLDAYASFTVECGNPRPNSRRGKVPENISSDSSSSDDGDFRREAYRLATNSKKRKKKFKGKKGDKTHGKRPVPSTSVAPAGLDGDNEWFFKVTVGSWGTGKKIIPEKNCLIRCNDSTTCAKLRELVGRELLQPPSAITLYDSDFLPLSDSPGRVGKYWSGTRKIFAVMSCAWESKYDGQQQSKAMLDISAAGAVKEAVNPLMAKIVAMDEKVEKVHNFMLKGPESVFKDIAIFAKEMFKCPICLAPPKDEIPYAVSCCNHVFCMPCIEHLVGKKDVKCPLCKHRRGPLYPVLLSGARELVEKVSAIPIENE